MNAFFGNWRTTVLGVAAGVLNYLVGLGPNLPTTGKEWGMVLLSAVLVAWGVKTKDADVGSKAP